jgi:twitching motility protein PilT
MDLLQLLTSIVDHKASDLHLTAEAPPLMRLNGELTPLAESAMGLDACRNMILGVLTESQRARLEQEWELDFALQVEGGGRFRGNAHYCRGALEATFRYIPHHIPELSELGHGAAVHQICELQRGLVLVTGMTGSGKSTTLAAMVKRISERLAGVIITIEDPVEFVFSMPEASSNNAKWGT